MLSAVRSFLRKNAPPLVAAYRSVKRYLEGRRLRRLNPEAVFTDIYRHNKWGGIKSVSGIGSDPDQTVIVRRELPRIMNELGVKKLLDIPCGDFSWFKDVDLAGATYVGADIVREMIQRNHERYGSARVEFVALNLLADPLPQADLVLCRDCLIHLSTEDVMKALHNLCASGSEYLLTTTFPSRKNTDITTGQWRPINLQASPFNLPRPVELLNEEYGAEGGLYRDKSLALWRIEQVRGALR